MPYIERELLIDDINHTLFYDNRDRATVKALALSLPGVDMVEVKHEESKKLTNFDRIKAEIESLEKLARIADKTIETQAKEIERLQKAVEDKGGLILMEIAKVEAYREFAERLKERADELKQVCLDGKWAISQYDVDKLLKELVGEGLRNAGDVGPYNGEGGECK